MKIYEFIWPKDRVEHLALHGTHSEEVEKVCFSEALRQALAMVGVRRTIYNGLPVMVVSDDTPYHRSRQSA